MVEGVRPAFKVLLAPVVTIWGVLLASVRFSGQAWGRGRPEKTCRPGWLWLV